MINKLKSRGKSFIKSSLKNDIDELIALNKENYWANVFNSSIKGSKWINDVPLNVGRWAANYSLLYILFRILNEIKPLNILELGLGETTKIFQAYKQFHNSNATCTTIEHNKEWIQIKKGNGISSEYINIVQLDTIETQIDNNETTLMYANFIDALKDKSKFDLILVDGPFGSNYKSRYNIIEMLEAELLSENFIIIIDDSQRKGEQETFNELINKMKKKGIDFEVGFYGGEKDQAIITHKSWNYVTSL